MRAVWRYTSSEGRSIVERKRKVKSEGAIQRKKWRGKKGREEEHKVTVEKETHNSDRTDVLFHVNKQSNKKVNIKKPNTALTCPTGR